MPDVKTVKCGWDLQLNCLGSSCIQVDLITAPHMLRPGLQICSWMLQLLCINMLVCDGKVLRQHKTSIKANCRRGDFFFFFWKRLGYGILVPSDRCHHMEDPADEILQTDKSKEGVLCVYSTIYCLSKVYWRGVRMLKWCESGKLKMAPWKIIHLYI